MHETGVRLADVVDRDDVRMVQGRRRARLLLEPREPVRSAESSCGQHLDRHLAAEPRVPRPIDLAHPAGAKRRDDFERAEASARRETHAGGKSSCVEAARSAQGFAIAGSEASQERDERRLVFRAQFRQKLQTGNCALRHSWWAPPLALVVGAEPCRVEQLLEADD